MRIGTGRVSGIRDVAERQLCCGCGACAFVQPEDIRMVDDVDHGRRPLVRDDGGRAVPTGEALAVCPGVGLERRDVGADEVDRALLDEWGPVLALWEGYAADDEVRFLASSGGAATALALHCLEREEMHGVLHIAARSDVPYLNTTVLSTTRAQMLAATGSRYAPASPCDRLDLVAGADAPCVFIGKPCDVAAAQRARAARPDLDARLGLTIAIFCAGTPSTRGTLEMVRRLGVTDAGAVESVRYRGKGWPGRAEVRSRGAAGPTTATLTYDESWGEILERHRQWRCYVCADHTGEFADVAVGDPWYRTIEPGEPGRSLVVARTERGRRLVERAIAAGALVLEPVDSTRLPASQPGLAWARNSVWGRVAACRAFGIPAPRYEGMGMFRGWRRLGLRAKLRSTVGTVRRFRRRGLLRRHPVVPFAPGGRSDRHDAPGA